jgi:hypothetical protein
MVAGALNEAAGVSIPSSESEVFPAMIGWFGIVW